MAVCSNSIQSSVRLMMSQAQLDEYLDVQLSNEDVVNSKPHPEIYLKAMKLLDCLPEECLIVEDNEHGIQAARASGGHVMVVSSPSGLNYSRIAQSIADAEKSSA